MSLVKTNSASMKGVKICVLGDISVGKTCLAKRYVDHTFTMHPVSLGTAFLSKVVFIEDQSFKMNIWDTAGSERFRATSTAYLRGAAIAVLVYDITCPESFEALQWWVRKLEDEGPEDVILTIAGNKNDLEEQKQVPEKEVKLYAENIDALFVETSAKTGDNVSLVFEEACKRFLEREKGRIEEDCVKEDHFDCRISEQDHRDGIIQLTDERPEEKKRKCCKI